MGPAISTGRTVPSRGRLVVRVGAAALVWMSLAASAHADGAGRSAGVGQTPGSALDSASLLQCATAGAASERMASFAGEMTAVAGAVRMGMRVELLERDPGEGGYHPVLAPGVGVWHYADPGVRAYKHVEQFTDLSAPANYRALITFRWDGPHGRTFKHDEQRTPRCQQPAPTPPVPEAPLE